MKGVQQQLRGEGDIRNEANPSSGFDAIELESVMGTQEREMWLDNRQQDHDLLVDVNDASIFYGDFPPLPDFPCMSSSSSSSSTPAPVKSVASSASTASSSSSAASWAVLKSDVDEDHVERRNNGHGHGHYHQHHHLQNDLVDGTPAALSSTASMEILQPPDQVNGVDCMDVMENFGYMDLLENNDFFDPSSIFHHDDTGLDQEFQQEQKPEEQTQQLEQEVPMVYSRIEETQADEKASDDLAMVFLEWLKTNKETVSAEDLRRVKIKKATIECAARRLGGGKEAMKQLLKLILEWVQTNHLQKRRIKESASNNNIDLPYQYQDPFQNPNPNSTFSSNPNLNCNSVPPPEPNSCFCQPPWIPQPAYVTDPSAAVVPGFAPLAGYMGDPFANGAPNVNSHTYQPPTDYQMLESAQTWPPSQFVLASQYNSFPETNLHPAQPSAFPGYANQYPCQYTHGHNNDQRIVRLGSSATKEARKKRMARQRRFAPHHRNHHNHPHHNQQSQHQNQSVDQHARLVSDNCVAAAAAQANPGNWVCWPAVSGGGVAPNPPVLPGDVPVVHPVDRPAMQVQTYQRQVASDRRQGWKPEKNLRFLLQKVLKQSDVGNLGRIVLPKKEAETHLPELEARDGISIAMEDIGTSRVWNMRYRFWPNNKSRMYLLENTGDFVRTNGLQEGDFIVIYSDVKCGKYLIRGVKVRQSGPKSETKRPGKSQKNQHANSPAAAAAVANGSSASPTHKH